MTPFLGQRLRGERGFERLYDRHVGDVYRYSLALLRNPTDAEDVTQTTFLNAYRAYRKGERPEAPRAWLIAIAHNVCRQRFRTAQRRVEEVAYEDGIAEAVVPDPDVPGAEDIQRALSHLAFNQRAALVMRELEGRSYAEIAAVLELSTSAVETLLFRARRALREQLEGALTCGEAELAISKQLDGRLSRGERGALRAHLRECEECSSFARKQRAQRSAFRALGVAPLPVSLASWGGGAAVGGAAVGGASTVAAGGGGVAVALKAAAVVAAGTVAVGVGREAVVATSSGPSDVSAAAAPATSPPAARPRATSAAIASTSTAAPAVRPARASAAGRPAAPGRARERDAAPKRDGRGASRAHAKRPTPATARGSS
ncbi:MAG: sigma-70 family RNA polymerase sigma factor, partial [Pseudomonadota bacterium]